MAATTHPAALKNHPARRRHHVSAWAMAFGLMGGAAAWLAHLLVNFALASEACSPRAPTFSAHALSEIHFTMMANGIAAMIIAALATWVAYANWRVTHEEERGHGA